MESYRITTLKNNIIIKAALIQILIRVNTQSRRKSFSMMKRLKSLSMIMSKFRIFMRVNKVNYRMKKMMKLKLKWSVNKIIQI